MKYWLSIYRHFKKNIDIDINKDNLQNIDIYIGIDKAILENIDIDKDNLENINIDKDILDNIDIDKDILESINIDIDSDKGI